MRRLAAVFIFVSAVTSVMAETPLMSGVDFLVDYKDFIGREVQVGPCKIALADASSVFCQVANPSGNRVGLIQMPSASMDRASLRRALTDCAGSKTVKQCVASSVTGTVSPNRSVPTLEGAVINWQ